MKNYNWNTDAPRPTITPVAAQLLVTISTITVGENFARLKQLIHSLQSSTIHPHDTTQDSLLHVIGRVKYSYDAAASLDLMRIADYIKLALLIDK
jgi:hypothetical protein